MDKKQVGSEGQSLRNPWKPVSGSLPQLRNNRVSKQPSLGSLKRLKGHWGSQPGRSHLQVKNPPYPVPYLVYHLKQRAQNEP